MKTKINHTMADVISVVPQEFAGDVSGSTKEIAFFQDTQWQTGVIPEFAEYHDGSPYDSETCVYTHVPNEKIEAFIRKYSS